MDRAWWTVYSTTGPGRTSVGCYMCVSQHHSLKEMLSVLAVLTHVKGACVFQRLLSPIWFFKCRGCYLLLIYLKNVRGMLQSTRVPIKLHAGLVDPINSSTAAATLCIDRTCSAASLDDEAVLGVLGVPKRGLERVHCFWD